MHSPLALWLTFLPLLHLWPLAPTATSAAESNAHTSNLTAKISCARHPPAFNNSRAEGRCLLLNDVCFQQSSYILFGKDVLMGSQNADLVPYFQTAGQIRSFIRHYDPFSDVRTVGSLVEYARVRHRRIDRVTGIRIRLHMAFVCLCM